VYYDQYGKRKYRQLQRLYRERRKFRDYIEPDPPKSINRPPAVYNNTSVREKYGL
jgi:hypothetical protein